MKTRLPNFYETTKKIIVTAAIIVSFNVKSNAQLGIPLALYSGNQIVYNPGYAGVYNLLSVNMSANKSWIGLPGSPSVINFNGHSPFTNQKHAYGWVFNREEWGPLCGNSVYANYSHKVYLESGVLNMGVQAGLLHHQVNWNKIEFVENWDDPHLGQGIEHSASFNAGVGFYYLASNWYLGVSAMDLMKPKYRTYGVNGDRWYAQVESKYFLMGGINLEMNETWSVRPEVFVRYTATANPVTANVGLHMFYQHRIGAGVMLRTGQSAVNFNLHFQATDNLRIGYSYGVTYNTIGAHQRGSHEIQISYVKNVWQTEDKTAELLWQ